MAGDMKDRLSGQANAAKGTAETTMKKAGERVKQEGYKFMDDQKSAAAHEIEKLGAALDAAADQLRKGNSILADVVENAADATDRASRAVAQGNAQELYRSANDFARQHPALVIAGLFTVGVALSRFFKAGAPEPEPVSVAPQGFETEGATL
jgi:plasmid stabilization system protein ParE